MTNVQFISACIALSLITIVICITVIEIKKYKIDKIIGTISAIGAGICEVLARTKE